MINSSFLSDMKIFFQNKNKLANWGYRRIISNEFRLKIDNKNIYLILRYVHCNFLHILGDK